MRYTIGCKVVDKKKDGLKTAEGIYAFGKYGLPFISAVEKLADTGDNHYIYIIDTIEDAQNFVKYLSRLYRKEFRSRAKNIGVSMNDFKFYLVRFDTPVFSSLKIKDSRPVKEKNCENVNLNNIHLCQLCATE